MRPSTRIATALGAALLPLVTAGCVDGDYNQYRVYQPPLVEAVEALEPGVTELQAALDGLGAPVFVIEVGRGMALAWGWQATTNWNVDVSFPLGDASGNFQFTNTSRKTRGLVLFFDEFWRLTAIREGFLVDLVPSRQLPRDTEDELLGPSPRRAEADGPQRDPSPEVGQ